MSENADWLDRIIQATETITASYYNAKSTQAAAEMQSSIDQGVQTTSNAIEKSNNTTRNILLIVGGTLGLILAFGVAKKLLK